MNELGVYDYYGLAARVNALRIAQRALRSNEPHAIQSIRRISRSLLALGESCHDAQISGIATTLNHAAETDLGASLQGMISQLRAIVTHIRSKKAGILIIDDDAVLREILQQKLSGPNRQIFTATSVAEAELILLDQDIALVILDLQLNEGDGRELLLKSRSIPLLSLPIIVVTSNRGALVQAECIALGADGFFEKPLDYAMLSTLVAAKLQQSVEVVRQSTLDPLTELPNRAAFQRAFVRMAQLARRYQEPLTVALLDIDRFKSINDHFGHPAGDRVLCRVAETLSRSLRASDLVSRWGGEEFAVLFPKAGIQEAQTALLKAQEAVRKEQFETDHTDGIHVTFSAGISRVQVQSTLEEVMAKADHFLYLAKHTGRDRILTESDSFTVGKTNILLVEDDDTTASILEYNLGRFGYNILRAKNGVDALRILSETPVALLTLDLQMPGMNGFEFLKKLRCAPDISHIPVIILTWDGEHRHMLEGFKLGADDYLLKPFSGTELLARVQKLLQHPVELTRPAG